jgi:hypothetical protein
MSIFISCAATPYNKHYVCMPLQQRKIEESSRHQTMAESIAKLEKSFEVSP